MTESIKLTENDFDYIHWKKDSAGPELFDLIIYGKSKLHCNEIKQQIVKKQEIVNDILKIVKRKLQSDEDKAIIKVLRKILSENKNLDFKEEPLV